MPDVYKLINAAKENACRTAEADAIRAKTGDSADIAFDFANDKGFADAIAAIETGGGGVLPYNGMVVDLWHEVVTITSDYDGNMTEAVAIVRNLTTSADNVFSISLHPKEAYVYNQFGGTQELSTTIDYGATVWRYRSGNWGSAWVRSDYVAALKAGDVFDVFLARLKTPT